MSESDEKADVITDSKGNPEADSSLRDTENVPLGQDVTEYFEREVVPYVPNAWINTKVIDHKDGEVGKVGYEIPFTRYFYEYKPPRDLKEIEADIQQTEAELAKLLRELTA
jgi:type I restriction enzyme M protein